MPKRSSNRESAPITLRAQRELDDYWRLSHRALHSLVFVLPMVVLYEVGSIALLTNPATNVHETIRAKRLLEVIFGSMGVAGMLVGGAAVLSVLIVQHVLSRDPWRVRRMVIAGMALEACLWALPMVVLGSIFVRKAAVLAPEAAVLTSTFGAADLASSLSPQTRTALEGLTISLGAGIYEEALFRFAGIAVVHLIAKDLLQIPELAARAIAVAVTAIAFGVYHPVWLATGGVNWPLLLYYTAAGVYFGVIYIGRGFGVVVGTHAVYDVIVLVILRPGGPLG
jgi:hypothetical protein